MNHDDVFILDSENKIYQFNGANSSIQERAKALEVIQFLKEKYHGGVCDVAIVGKGTCFLYHWLKHLLYSSILYFYFVDFNIFSLLTVFKIYSTLQMMESWTPSQIQVNFGSFLVVLLPLERRSSMRKISFQRPLRDNFIGILISSSPTPKKNIFMKDLIPKYH